MRAKRQRNDDNDDLEDALPSCHDQLPSVEEAKVFAAVEDTEKGNLSKNKRRATVVLVFVLVASFLLLGLMKLVPLLRDDDSSKYHSSDSSSWTTPQDEEMSNVESRLRRIIFNHQPRGGKKVDETTSSSSLSFLHDPPGYQYMAFQRLVRQEHYYATYSQARLQQIYGLLALYYATNNNDSFDENDESANIIGDRSSSSSSSRSWPHAIYWQRSHDECQWEGITCDSEHKVVEMDLTNFGLHGVIPSEIALVAESVRRIRLDNNPGLQGQVPAVLGRLHNLEELSLTGCGYIGEMPEIVCQLKIHNADMVLQVDCLERIACDLVCCEVCA